MPLVSDRFQAKVSIGLPDDCWPWTGSRNRDGYGQVMLEGKKQKAHRVVLAWKLGRPIKPGKQSMHTCDNPPCCNPDHLREGSHAENMEDSRQKGRSKPPVHTPENLAKMRANTPRGERHWTKQHPEQVPAGEANPFSKLTWEIVRDIRARRAAGQTLKEIAPVYGISLVTVSMICLNQAWVEPGQERVQKRRGKPGPAAKPEPVFICQRAGCGKEFSRRKHTGRPAKYCSGKCAATANYGNLGAAAQGRPPG